MKGTKGEGESLRIIESGERFDPPGPPILRRTFCAASLAFPWKGPDCPGPFCRVWK